MKDLIFIHKTKHYLKDDPEQKGDYYEVSLGFYNSTLDEMIYEISYGDHYHDKGDSKAEAVIEFFTDYFQDEFKIEVWRCVASDTMVG